MFNSAGAFFGGVSLIRYPDGSALRLDPALLWYTPFTSYLVPGIVLLVTNGLLSAVACGMLLTGHKRAAGGVFLQGVILEGWILVQMVMIRVVFVLHVLFLLLAPAFIFPGMKLKKAYR